MDTDMVTKVLLVDGMSRLSCGMKIEGKVSKLQGVEYVETDYKKGTACVTFDNKQIELINIVETIEALEYTISSVKESVELPLEENLQMKILYFDGKVDQRQEKEIKNVLRQLAGIKHAEINVDSKAVFLTYDEDQIEILTVVEAIEAIGLVVESIKEKSENQSTDSHDNFCTKKICVEGMIRPDCVREIESSLKRLKGVELVKADFDKETVLVTYDESKIGLSKIEKELEALDFVIHSIKGPDNRSLSSQGLQADVQRNNTRFSISTG